MPGASSDARTTDAEPVRVPNRSALEEYERDGRPPFILTYTEVKLLGIAGVSTVGILELGV